MGFWDIILEAKKSSSKQPNKDPKSDENPEEESPEEEEEKTAEDDNGGLELDVEADNASEEGEDGVDDFSGDISSEEDPNSSNEDEDGVDNFDDEVMGDNTEENPEGGEAPVDGGEDPSLNEDGSETPPEGEDGDPGTDNNLEDEQKDNDTVTREYNLLCDFEELYDLVINCMGILEKLKTKDIVVSHIANTCNKNFADILDRIDRYIHFNYKTKSYVENLTIYNYLVQSTKITIEMLKNVKNLANI